MCRSSSLGKLLDPGRMVLRVAVACAVVSACAGWVLSGGHVSRVTELFRAAAVPLSTSSWLVKKVR